MGKKENHITRQVSFSETAYADLKALVARKGGNVQNEITQAISLYLKVENGEIITHFHSK